MRRVLLGLLLLGSSVTSASAQQFIYGPPSREEFRYWYNNVYRQGRPNAPEWWARDRYPSFIYNQPRPQARYYPDYLRPSPPRYYSPYAGYRYASRQDYYAPHYRYYSPPRNEWGNYGRYPMHGRWW